MRYLYSTALLALLLGAAVPSGYSQLRNLSEYTHDCIHLEQTGFTAGGAAAEYRWASEWTHTTAYAYPDKTAILLWKFKDGTKAYSNQGDFFLGDLGKATGYLITGHAKELEDIHGRKIQPMTLSNFPVALELWIGEIHASTGYAPESQLDRVCFEAQEIQPNEAQHFVRCH